MKSGCYTLLLLLICPVLYAQNQPLFTLTEMEQLANCPNHACFRRAVSAKGYEFNKTETITTESGTLNTHSYRILSTGQQPYRPEHIVTYAEHGPLSRSVHFLTKSPAFPAQLEADINRQGYVLTGQANPAQDRQYSREAAGLVWTLDRHKPGFSPSKGVPTYTISLFSRPKPATQPTNPVSTQPVSAEPAHLGGDWDAKYPPQAAADLFNAERRYAADYDRKHGKVGHTFSRCEKVRIQATYTGQYRPLTDDRWNSAFDVPLRHSNFSGFADRRADLYRQEALLQVDSESVWMPVQEPLIGSFRQEATPGKAVTLYAVLVSHHDFGGTLHLSFLVNEFAAAKNEASATSDPTPKATAATNKPGSTQPTAAVAQKAPASCGFNWIPWSSVSANEKNKMQKVLVMGDDAPNVGLLRFIADELAQGNKIQIARHDFFSDNEPGYVVYIAYMTPQYGDIGRVEVFENLGASKLWPPAHVKTTLCAVRPFDNGDTQRRRRGVIGDDGQLQEFLGSLFFDRSYAQFLEKTRPPAPVAIPGKASHPEDFKAFIQRFSTDRAFQLSRVQFPLVWEAYTNDETIPHRDTKANWKHINILQPTDSIYKVFVNYPTSAKPAEARVSETCRGGDCGFSYGMSFRRVNGLWYCVSRHLSVG